MATATADIAWLDDESTAANAAASSRAPGTIPVTLTFLAPIDPAAAGDRKALAAAAREEIVAALAASAAAGRSPIGAAMNRPATFAVKSFGCQMNVYDGERMAELLEADGLTLAADPAAADLVVLNTCHIREKATEKVYSEIGRLKRARRLAADDRGRRLRRPGRRRGDRAAGEGRRRRRPAGLSQSARAGRRGGARAGPRSTPTCRRCPSSARCRRGGGRGRAPSSPCRKAATNSAPIASCPIRAAPRSRGRSAAIVDEAQALVDAGAREITLLGQNVNAWARWRARAGRPDPRARRAAGPRAASATRPAIPTT